VKVVELVKALEELDVEEVESVVSWLKEKVLVVVSLVTVDVELSEELELSRLLKEEVIEELEMDLDLVLEVLSVDEDELELLELAEVDEVGPKWLMSRAVVPTATPATKIAMTTSTPVAAATPPLVLLSDASTFDWPSMLLPLHYEMKS
jgi:hypothetical protein